MNIESFPAQAGASSLPNCASSRECLQVSSEILERWLFWAGAKLIAMPAERIKPAQPKAIWPDYAIDRYQILEFRQKIKVRIPPPSNDEIPIMDEILLFPNLCEFVNRRRVIHLRLLTNPVSGNPINSWEKISRILRTSVPRTKRFYYSGITEIGGKLSNEKIAKIGGFFADSGNLG